MTGATIDRAAIFSDGTANFVTPCEPGPYETVAIRCRVGRGQAEQVTAVIENVRHEMRIEKTTPHFDYYATTFLLPNLMDCFLY